VGRCVGLVCGEVIGGGEIKKSGVGRIVKDRKGRDTLRSGRGLCWYS